MKTNINFKVFPIIGATVLGLILPSCVSEEFVDYPDTNDPSTVGTAGKRYFAAFNVNNFEGFNSRAVDNGHIDDFEHGTEEESSLYLNYPGDEVHHVLLLFDKDGKQIGFDDPENEGQKIYVLPLTLTPKDQDGDDDEDQEEGNGDEEDENPEENPEDPETPPTDDPEQEETEDKSPWIDAEYTYLYTDIPKEIVNAAKGATVLTVLNASTDLVNKLKTAAAGTWDASSAYTSTMGTLQDFSTNSDFFLEKDNKRYHTMTSSMIINKEGKVQPASDGELKFWETAEKAKKNPYTLYVERMLSKYTVSFLDPDKKRVILTYDVSSTEPEITDDPAVMALMEEEEIGYVDRLVYEKAPIEDLKLVKQYTRSESIEKRREINPEKYPWKVNVIGWGINGLESKENLFKNINEQDNYKWAESQYQRYLWAHDPHYSDALNSYPYQFTMLQKYDETNKTFVNYTDKDVPTYQNGVHPLEYISFNKLSNKDLLTYIPENTFQATGIQIGNNPVEDKSYLRLNSHLIVTAQLLIEGFDNDDVYKCEQFGEDGLATYYETHAESKYRMNDIYWSEEAYKTYVAEYLGYWMLTDENQSSDRFGPNDGIFYIDENGTIASAKDFILEHAFVKDGDSRVCLSPNSGVKLFVRNPNYRQEVTETDSSEDSTDPPAIDNGSDGLRNFAARGEGDEDNEGSEEESNPNESDSKPEKEYTEISSVLFQLIAYEHPELMAEKFEEGRMYYVAGTQHYPAGSSMIATGNYGTLRNYWYNFTVESFSKPGVPVAFPDANIIPNNLPLTDAMGISIKIMDWHSESASIDVNDQNRPGSSSNDPEEGQGDSQGGN